MGTSALWHNAACIDSRLKKLTSLQAVLVNFWGSFAQDTHFTQQTLQPNEEGDNCGFRLD